MPNVKDVLRRYRSAPPPVGPSAAPRRSAESLARDLEQVSRSNQVYFIICFASVLALFVAAGVVLVRYVDEPNRIAAVLGALGVSVMGLIAQMTALWKQKVSADLLIVLSREADEAQLRKIIDALLKKL